MAGDAASDNAAKCPVIMVKVGKKRTRYVLAEELAGSVTGAVLPVSYSSQLELIADPSLLNLPELFFNAARLDRSVALATEDYLRLARPRLERIAATP